MESVALLTKYMGIVTPLILSIVVVVALRLISYSNQSSDRIIHGLQWHGRKREMKQSSPMYLRGKNEVQSNRNTTQVAEVVEEVDLIQQAVLTQPTQGHYRTR